MANGNGVDRRWRFDNLSQGIIMSMDGGKWSIIIFVGICALNGFGLALDEALDRNGLGTITAWIRMHKAWGIPIILLQAMATVALAWHFWAPPPPPEVVPPGTPNMLSERQP